MEQACEVDGFDWSCQVPSTEIDLRLTPVGMVSRYFWNIRASPEEGLDLGLVGLASGASLAGWVTWPDGDGCRQEDRLPTVEVRPDLYGERPGSSRTAQTDRLIRSQTVNPRGFFQIDNVEPGAYVVRASAPGLSALEHGPVHLGGEREHLLDEPLKLQPLARLEVFVTPQTDPYNEPWRVQLKRRLSTSLLQPIAEREVSEQGYWIEVDLEDGPYSLAILDSRDSSHLVKDVNVTSDTPLIELELPIVRIQGRLTLGKEAMAGRLELSRMGRGVVHLEAGEDGTFEGFLAEGGEWILEVHHQDPSFRIAYGPVEVVKQTEDGTYFLDVAVPSTHLLGHVVDEDGEPVPRAMVSIYRDRFVAELETDGEARFEVYGLEAGEIRLKAASEELASPFEPHVLEEDARSEPLEIVVYPSVEARFRAVSAGRPVAGASIHYKFPHQPTGFLNSFTGPNGTFSARVVDSPREVELDLAILAPGHHAKISRLAFVPRDRSTVDVPIGRVGGELKVGLDTSVYVFREGVGVPVWALFDKERMVSGRGIDPQTVSVIVAAESGEYSVCPSPVQTSSCSSGVLAVGGELFLEHREAAERARSLAGPGR